MFKLCVVFLDGRYSSMGGGAYLKNAVPRGRLFKGGVLIQGNTVHTFLVTRKSHRGHQTPTKNSIIHTGLLSGDIRCKGRLH